MSDYIELFKDVVAAYRSLSLIDWICGILVISAFLVFWIVTP